STCSGACAAGRYGPDVNRPYTTDQCYAACAAGYYGSTTGLIVSTCTGLCDAGYYGGTTGLTVSTCTGTCAAGYYGSAAGRPYTVNTCTGACTAGYYCTAGSITATQNVCGANKYCPVASPSANACTADSSTNGLTTEDAATDCHCNTDYYDTDGDTGGRACAVVGTGYYSANYSDARSACTNKAYNSDYSGSGGGVNNCPFNCHFSLTTASSCTATGVGANIIFNSGDSCYQTLTVETGSTINIQTGVVIRTPSLQMNSTGDQVFVDAGGKIIIGSCVSE
ncbi:MAG: hypothetical protein Q8L21_03600, partial [Candidatus Komeilibacteria bacterium]|nr:hypothetical protein [Candidatus Komeilibacteria bacterium]